MSNGNDFPKFPDGFTFPANDYSSGFSNQWKFDQTTVVKNEYKPTKLEYFAGLALQGLLANSSPTTGGWFGPAYAISAVKQAKYLIAELEKEQ